jgi:hypothetical protein
LQLFIYANTGGVIPYYLAHRPADGFPPMRFFAIDYRLNGFTPGFRREDGFMFCFPPFQTIHKILLTSPLFPPILLILTPLFCGLLIVSAGRRYKILNPIVTAESTPDMFLPKRENIEVISKNLPPAITNSKLNYKPRPYRVDFGLKKQRRIFNLYLL